MTYSLKILITINLLLLGCATSDTEIMDNSHPNSDIQGSFMTQEPRSVREREDTPNMFFYNECSPTGDGSYYSKSSYFCEDKRH